MGSIAAVICEDESRVFGDDFFTRILAGVRRELDGRELVVLVIGVAVPAAVVLRPELPVEPAGHLGQELGLPVQEQVAPVLLGELSTTLTDPRDQVWLRALLGYLGKGADGIDFTFWSWNPNSGDTGGILNDDWTTVNTTKQAYLDPYLIPADGAGTSPPQTASCSVGFNTGGPGARPSGFTLNGAAYAVG